MEQSFGEKIISLLPKALSTIIYEFLTLEDMAEVSLVNQYFHQVDLFPVHIHVPAYCGGKEKKPVHETDEFFHFVDYLDAKPKASRKKVKSLSIASALAQYDQLSLECLEILAKMFPKVTSLTFGDADGHFEYFGPIVCKLPLTKLKVGSSVDDDGVESFLDFKLTDLNFYSEKMTIIGLQSICTITTLVHLKIDGAIAGNCGKEELLCLSKLQNLESLSLRTDLSSLIPGIQSLKYLKKLETSGYTSYYIPPDNIDEALKELAACSFPLESLSFSGIAVSLVGLRNLVSFKTSLKKLNLINCIFPTVCHSNIELEDFFKVVFGPTLSVIYTAMQMEQVAPTEIKSCLSFGEKIISLLPNELATIVYEFLTLKDTAEVSLVNQYFHELDLFPIHFFVPNFEDNTIRLHKNKFFRRFARYLDAKPKASRKKVKSLRIDSELAQYDQLSPESLEILAKMFPKVTSLTFGDADGHFEYFGPIVCKLPLTKLKVGSSVDDDGVESFLDFKLTDLNFYTESMTIIGLQSICTITTLVHLKIRGPIAGNCGKEEFLCLSKLQNLESLSLRIDLSSLIPGIQSLKYLKKLETSGYTSYYIPPDNIDEVLKELAACSFQLESLSTSL